MISEQLQIAGTEGKKIKEIEKAAAILRDVRTRRMALTEEEGKAASKLKAVMEKNGLKLYVFESDELDDDDNPITLDVVLDGEPKVKVRKHKEAKIETADANETDVNDD